MKCDNPIAFERVIMKYQYHIDGTLPMNEPIFVFGSNESGIHGAGAARVARDLYGAKLGVGFGPMGRCWAIPTKNWKVESLDLEAVRHYIKRFKEYVASSAEQFFITRVGCGLAGYRDEEIAPMFIGSPANCNFPEQWKEFLEC